MELELLRDRFTAVSTTGKLVVNGDFECYTLEDVSRPYPDKVPKETCIWPGTYKVVIDFSNRFQKLMPHVLDVKMFEGIRIHAGNYPVDTEGCILLGQTRSTDFVGSSVKAFNAFFVKLQEATNNGESVTLTIEERR